MSIEVLESVIGKALLDTEFRNLLMIDPETALVGFELSDTEKARLINSNRQSSIRQRESLGEPTSKE